MSIDHLWQCTDWDVSRIISVVMNLELLDKIVKMIVDNMVMQVGSLSCFHYGQVFFLFPPCGHNKQLS